MGEESVPMPMKTKRRPGAGDFMGFLSDLLLILLLILMGINGILIGI